MSADVGTAVNPDFITRSMETSLQLLGLEYVDIYYPDVARLLVES